MNCNIFSLNKDRNALLYLIQSNSFGRGVESCEKHTYLIDDATEPYVIVVRMKVRFDIL